MLYEFATQYHRTVTSVSGDRGGLLGSDAMTAPRCKHGPTKVAKVKKEGRTKGRLFYACAAGRNRCDFFEWVSDNVAVAERRTAPKGIEVALQRKGIALYTQCNLFCSQRYQKQKLDKLKKKDEEEKGEKRESVRTSRNPKLRQACPCFFLFSIFFLSFFLLCSGTTTHGSRWLCRAENARRHMAKVV